MVDYFCSLFPFLFQVDLGPFPTLEGIFWSFYGCRALAKAFWCRCRHVLFYKRDSTNRSQEKAQEPLGRGTKQDENTS